MKVPVSSLAIAGLLIIGAAPVSAQKTVDGVVVPKGNTIAEVRQRQAANDEQVKAAQAQLDQNAASQAAHDQAVQAYNAELARISQQAADADKAHQDAMAKWEADVAACKAGDAKRCSGAPAK
jgi:chromosome segregation ATPase